MEQTPNQNSEKIEIFLKEYGELVTKHNVDFANYPMFMPDGEGNFKIVIQTTPVDMDKMPIRSPFVAKA